MVDPQEDRPGQIGAILAAPHLADALDSEPFRHFLDQIPIAIAVSEIKNSERITYANPEFEALSGLAAADIVGKSWDVLRGQRTQSTAQPQQLAAAIVELSDCAGTFVIDREGQDAAIVDTYSNIIQDIDGVPVFRLAALIDVGAHEQGQEGLSGQLAEKDTLLREVQHRVKNNLQMITALIRIEARNAQGKMETAPFDRLAGRIEAIGLLYNLLSDDGKGDEIDLGIYLSAVASAVIKSHANEGIRLDLKVDTYPVSASVAMPAGLIVNELLTNSLKHAFRGRDRGTITLHSLTDKRGCNVVIADDGSGMPEGIQWPQRGKLGALIVRSLRENANANMVVETKPGSGTKVTISFTRAAAAPDIQPDND